MAGTIDLYSLKGRARKLSPPTLGENVEDVPAMNDRTELLANCVLPPKTELARLNNTWSVKIATANAFTSVAAMPTTLAALLLYNGELSNGKSYLIDSVWALGTASMAAAGSNCIVAQYAQGIAAPTDDTGQLITSRSGVKSYTGRALKAVAQTTMTANKWELLNNSINGGAATAQIGLAVFAECYGGWILRPGDTFGVNLIAGTAAATSVIMGITWHEVQLP